MPYLFITMATTFENLLSVHYYLTVLKVFVPLLVRLLRSFDSLTLSQSLQQKKMPSLSMMYVEMIFFYRIIIYDKIKDWSQQYMIWEHSIDMCGHYYEN